MDLRAVYRQTVVSGNRTVYVDATNGSDSNNGTSLALAYATIQKAANSAQAGDRILVNSGTYGYVSIYGRNGNAKKWISFESLNDSVRPIISVADNSGNDGLDIQQSSYIGIYGFEIVGLQTSSSTNPSGIGIFRGSTRIFIWNNDVHDFPGGGVNCFWVDQATYGGSTLPSGSWDLVDISFNTIHATSKYSQYNTSGISFYGAIDYTGTTLDGTYGYRAVGNYIYDVICTVNYSPGGYNFVTDGNGISCDSLNTPNNLAPDLIPYVKRGLVEGNVITGCGGRAVHIYNTINIDDIFGTYIGNLRTSSPAITNGVETDAKYDNNPANCGVIHYGCVISPLNTPNVVDGLSTYTNCVFTGGTQSLPSGSIDRRSDSGSYFTAAQSTSTVVTLQPAANFLPVRNDVTTKTAIGLGYQMRGTGYRTNGTTAQWRIGAIEAPIKPLVILTR